MRTDRRAIERRYGFKNPFKPDPFVRKAVRYLPSGGELLDVGCGEGADSAYFASHGFTVHAIDRNRSFLARFRRYCKGEKLSAISIERGDATTYRYPRNAYDVVSSILAVCCMKRSEAGRVVRALRRAVKPGGIVVVSSRNYLDPEMKECCGGGTRVEPNTFCNHDCGGKYIYFMEKGRLRKLFEGFKILYYYEGYAGCKYGEHRRHGDSYIVCKRPT
jgi:2-polyprenyl-3-methyl-5-hydroxy-6-metoxy-1,4-benzoquinol methylase